MCAVLDRIAISVAVLDRLAIRVVVVDRVALSRNSTW